MTNSNPHLQPNPKRILVIAMQFLGDVLLATPLLHSLRQTYPEAKIDILVYANTAAMLSGNADIDDIIGTPNRPKPADYRRLLPRIFCRYDLAVALQTGDRPFLYSLLAAPFRISAVPPKNSKGWWKRYFVQRWIEFDDSTTHTVIQHLKLLDLPAAQKSFALVAPKLDDTGPLMKRFAFLTDGGVPYAVLHPHPQWTYKRWTTEGWIETGRYLEQLGFKVVLSGGPAQDETDYIAAIAKQFSQDAVNLAGQVTLAELAAIIAGAKLFIGPDTGITHLAAATGIPVIALYGPTNPVKWAPWPKDYQSNVNPFRRVGSQQVNNIILLQGQGDCVPCHLEGCDRHRQSRSRCLEELSAEIVKQAMRRLLNRDKV